jgi:hypothetical protein
LIAPLGISPGLHCICFGKCLGINGRLSIGEVVKERAIVPQAVWGGGGAVMMGHGYWKRWVESPVQVELGNIFVLLILKFCYSVCSISLLYLDGYRVCVCRCSTFLSLEKKAEFKNLLLCIKNIKFYPQYFGYYLVIRCETEARHLAVDVKSLITKQYILFFSFEKNKKKG